jgi:hypothetical protein
VNQLGRFHCDGHADHGGRCAGEQHRRALDSTLRAGRSAGVFANTASELELKYTAFQNFRISAGTTPAYYDMSGIAGMGDTRHAAMLCPASG